MKKPAKKTSQKPLLLRFYKSIWLFPAFLTVILLLLTALKINGSSVGTYQAYFYPTKNDPNLISGRPEYVRSDEFLNNTQMTLAQSKDNYPEVNNKLGYGENMSLIEDAPYKGWSEVFKPHNLIFFVLPTDYAFAFKWWLMGYLLLVSCYFFVLSILPGKRLLAAGIAVALLFSAFVQWWYQYITLGPIYYSLFIATAFVHFLKQKRLRNKLLLAAAITYLTICFVLVFYPPFQIACALALLGFLVGELIVYYRGADSKEFLKTLGWLAGSGIISLSIVGLFILTRTGVINAIDDTVYPGHRIIVSGTFNIEHLLSGNLGFQFISTKKTADYRLFGQVTNQSEASNFLLLTPFLLLPSLYLLYDDKKQRKKTDWPLLGVVIVFILFMFELFVPAFTAISKLFFFEKIPLQRDLIGLGLLNIIQLVLFIRNLSKKKRFSKRAVVPYVALVFCIEVIVGIYAEHHFPGFIGQHRAIAFALPVPIIIYFLLRKRFALAMVVYAAFSVFTSLGVNPLYHGLSVIEHNPVNAEVQQVVKKYPNARWVTDGLVLENFALLNGAPSLSGLYYYPQPNIWKNIGPGDQSFIYNRYANVNFQLLTTGNPNFTQLQLLGGDDYSVNTNVCSNFLKDNHVMFALTPQQLVSKCVTLVKQVSLPGGTFSIYRLS